MHANPEYLANFATVFRVISLGPVPEVKPHHAICEWPTCLSIHSAAHLCNGAQFELLEHAIFRVNSIPQHSSNKTDAISDSCGSYD